jgi:hypothetical protein
MLGSLLLLALAGFDVPSLPLLFVAAPIVVALLAAMGTVAVMPLLVPAPLALLTLPVASVATVAGLSFAFT